jgi:uncharacterized iron-regulated protein
MPDNLEHSEEVTLALLRNDLMHLKIAVELLRSDLQKMALDWATWRSDIERQAKVTAAEIATLASQMTIIKWAFGLVT